jgi:VWFA-related protein
MRAASVLFALAAAAAPQAPSFKSAVQGVRVDVLVTDGGKPLNGLTAADFELLDNGVQQAITLLDFDQLPLNVILVFDMSASVTRVRLGHLRRAASALLDGLTTNDQAGLVTFSHAIARQHGLTSDVRRLREALANVQPIGGTALVDGTYAGMMVAESDVGRSLLIVFSDGVDTASWLSPDGVLQTARRSDVVVYGVAVGTQKPEFLRDLARATGGEVFENESDETFEQRFVSMLSEFRRRYVLMFTPSSNDPGWHRLQVRVKGRRATIRARPGYLAEPGHSPRR